MPSNSSINPSLVAKFGNLSVDSKPPTGLSREKAKPLLLKSNSSPITSVASKPSLVPHPPQMRKPVSVPSSPKKPTPPSTPKGKTNFTRKFVRSEEQTTCEYRMCGDGEANADHEEFAEQADGSYVGWERQPGDGCFSDITEEGDSDLDDYGNEDIEEDEALDNLEGEYFDCDEMAEEDLGFSEDDDDDSISIATSNASISKSSSAKSRVQSARLSVNLRITSGDFPNSKPKLSGDLSCKAKANSWIESDANQPTKPALTASLFAYVQPTIHFTVEGEKVESLPSDLRKLLRWKMSSITPNVVKQCIARSGFRPTKRAHDWLGYWGKHMKSTTFKSIREYQKVNHFPGTFQIGRKDRLWRNLSKMMVHHGKKEFGFLPQTYVLPYDFKLLKRAWDEGGSRQKWILKPPASARGIGIRVIHKWTQIPRKRPVIVQKYLHKPFLINGSKFDLRIYVYVTSYDPLRIYIFEDGLVRFATCKYSSSVKSLSNRFMHLTNYSVNKKNEGAYQSNADDSICQGHKWSLKSLWGYFKRMGINHAQVWDSVKDVIVKAIIASDSFVNTLIKQNVRHRSCCHELFGCDVMLDENLKPWLLEVNISPSLHSNSQLDRNIKGQMIRDLMNLAAFRIPENLVTTTTASASSLNSFVQDKSTTSLSSDERAKHAFYVGRNVDERTRQSILDILTPSDVRILMETEDEYSRRGCFQRAFPSMVSHKYLRFFESTRYYNILLDEWTRKFMREGRSTALGVAILQGLAEQKLHLGPTTDPNHQWSCPQGMSYRSLSAPAVGLDHCVLKPSASMPVLLPRIKKKTAKSNHKTSSGSTASLAKSRSLRTKAKSSI
ncbi:tubulin monoglutamylase TTLL4 isoform X2 [Nematostella vectensis]|uniref:tubulin monoglutamylase TTLL4 isoform X2 n=1 Tax=Nematostella vectensis TaxID=45351 RepID=UPI0020776B7C|nr:tubulin monoglutamylase TTLL4 isoform X2 [Nematostella vectensis]